MSNYNLLKINSKPLPNNPQVVWDSSFGIIDHREAEIIYPDLELHAYQGSENGVGRPIWVYARLSNGLWYKSSRRPTNRRELTDVISTLRKSRKQVILNKIEAMKKISYTLMETFHHLDYLFTKMVYTPDWLIRGTMLDLQSTFNRDNLNMWYPFLLVSRNINIRLSLVRKKKMLDNFCDIFDSKFSLDSYIPSLKLEEYVYSEQDVDRITRPMIYEDFLELLGDVSEIDVIDMIGRYGGRSLDRKTRDNIPLTKRLYNLLF